MDHGLFDSFMGGCAHATIAYKFLCLKKMCIFGNKWRQKMKCVDKFKES